MGMVRTHFRPEYLNRIDEIILFHRLQKSEMGAIVEIQFGRLRRLLEDRKIDLVLDAKGRDWLAEKGRDPAYGARPLKREIQRSVQALPAEPTKPISRSCRSRLPGSIALAKALIWP